MISRSDTVNLSNMPVVSEKPFAETSESEKDGKAIGKLAKMFSLKSETTSSDATKGWKITRFEKTPLVRPSDELHQPNWHPILIA